MLDLRSLADSLRRRFDRDRVGAFLRFLARRFLDDRCFQSAGALSYTTVFALVPLTAATLGIVSVFPVFDVWSQQLTGWIFENFVPDAARAVQEYLTQFASGASRLTAAGVIALLLSALLMMASVEDAFNRIWRVTTPRRTLARFVVYWTALTLGPLLVVGSLAISSYLFSLPLISETAQEYGLQRRLLGMLPTLVVLTAFTMAYVVIPNRTVAFRHAFLGALVATLLFEASKFALATYLGRVTTYQQIYGTLAVIPIFLIWIYIAWSVVLLGASLAASLSAFRYLPPAMRLPAGLEFYGLLRVVERLDRARSGGRGHGTEELRQLEPLLSDDQLVRILDDLQRARVVHRTELGEWVLVRDTAVLRLGELYQSGAYRLPAELPDLPCQNDEIGRPVRGVLERLQRAVSDVMDTPFAGIVSASARSDENRSGDHP
ncbi:MAG TPA: YihY family inner membrane protein [Xanthomonadaceae bacterium]|nr:YihY family inner membrane protein [Xanthomonadaceae bacterium]